MGACKSCGVYRNIQHRPTCCPGRKFQLQPSRQARRDSLTSAVVRINLGLQDRLVRDL